MKRWIAAIVMAAGVAAGQTYVTNSYSSAQIEAGIGLANTALQTADIDTLAELNAIVTNATLADASGYGTAVTNDTGDFATAAQGSAADTALQAESDPLALKTAGANNVTDAHIDWGTGPAQVSAADVPIADTGGLLAAADVEAALAEMAKVPVKTTAANYVVGTTSAREAYGGIIYVTAAATITAPAVVDGMHFTVIVLGLHTVSVDVNAADLIWLDGVALDDGDKATSTGTSGETITLIYLDATGWVAISDGWTDGGA